MFVNECLDCYPNYLFLLIIMLVVLLENVYFTSKFDVKLGSDVLY